MEKNSPIYILADFVYIRHIYIHILVCVTNMYTYILMYNTSIERGLLMLRMLLLYRKIYDMLKEAKEESLSEIN